MPISPIILQRRHAELGRIRLGNKTGSGKGRPQKLAQFRFTSPGEQYIKDLAELYGGDARAWDNNGKPEFEVLSTASSIPVIVVKGGLSQWMETWSGGGIVHRCDGERDIEGNLCDPNDKGHQEAKPTTRLSVMLPELEAVGVFRMESHGWNAAAEIPAVAELAQFVGDLVPAVLHLVERRTVKDGQTSRFVVPVLDLQIGTERLKEVAAAKSGASAALEGNGNGPKAAITSGATGRDWATEAAATTGMDDLRELWRQAAASGDFTDKGDQLKALMQPHVERLQSSGAGATGEGQQQPPAAGGAPAPGTDNPDVVWQAVLAEAGRLSMTLDDVEADFATRNGGVSPETASAGELSVYLETLQSLSEYVGAQS